MARACICALTVEITALVMDSVTIGCLKYGLKGVYPYEVHESDGES